MSTGKGIAIAGIWIGVAITSLSLGDITMVVALAALVATMVVVH